MTQRYLKYTVDSSTTPRTSFINLARDLSAMNRGLYRQTRMYKVRSIRVSDDDGAKYVQFGCAPNTWAMKNSLKRAYSRWNEMNKQVLKDQPSLKSKWMDFKPYLSPLHMQVVEAGTGGTLETPEDIGGQNLQYGDWQTSMFESPDGTSSVDGYKVGLLGQQVGSSGTLSYVGLIESYGNTRATVQDNDPNVNTALASDDPLLNLLDAGTQFDEVAENIIDENDAPPYLLDAGGGKGQCYVGGQSNMRNPLMFAEVCPSETKTPPPIFNVDIPLGVFRVDHALEAGESDTNFTIIVELAPGGYKGVHSEALV